MFHFYSFIRTKNFKIQKKACLSKYGCRGSIKFLEQRHVKPNCCQTYFRSFAKFGSFHLNVEIINKYFTLIQIWTNVVPSTISAMYTPLVGIQSSHSLVIANKDLLVMGSTALVNDMLLTFKSLNH